MADRLAYGKEGAWRVSDCDKPGARPATSCDKPDVRPATSCGAVGARYLSNHGVWAVVAVAVVLCACLLALVGAGEASPAASDYRLTKAAIVDNTASSEADSAIDTSEALLEGLSFAQKNPFFLNVRETLAGSYSFPLPTDSWIEKCEWTYDASGRVKTAAMYKSSNDLSRIELSYDSHDSISKIVGSVVADDGDGRGVVSHDFEVSVVNETLSSGTYGANKFTVVHDSPIGNDTVLFTYDKDKNLTSVASAGGHAWSVAIDYITALKVPKTLKLSADGQDGGMYLEPTYDSSNKNRLVSLRTGTWSGSDVQLSGYEYQIQYSGDKYSRVRCYQDDVEVKYYEFAYDKHGNLESIRVYKKGGSLLYSIALSYERA